METTLGEFRQRLLLNVWFGDCGTSVTITHFTGHTERGGLNLTAQCRQCQGEVARVDEGTPQHRSAAAYLTHALFATFRARRSRPSGLHWALDSLYHVSGGTSLRLFDLREFSSLCVTTDFHNRVSFCHRHEFPGIKKTA